jgi:F-type H+-transporting ATPase subunit alpha
VPVEDIGRFESELLDYIGRERAGIFDTIRETGDLSEDTVTALQDAIGTFRRGFETSSGELLVRDEPVEPVDEAEIVPEGIARTVTRAKK